MRLSNLALICLDLIKFLSYFLLVLVKLLNPVLSLLAPLFRVFAHILMSLNFNKNKI